VVERRGLGYRHGLGSCRRLGSRRWRIVQNVSRQVPWPPVSRHVPWPPVSRHVPWPANFIGAEQTATPLLKFRVEEQSSQLVSA
jgi:hypothetical protein